METIGIILLGVLAFISTFMWINLSQKNLILEQENAKFRDMLDETTIMGQFYRDSNNKEIFFKGSYQKVFDAINQRPKAL